MAARRGRNTRAYRRKSARVRKQASQCWICQGPIDPSLDYRHPLSATADHVDPLATGGHILGELRPAHRSCNSARGVGRTVPVPVERTSSRAW